MAKTLAKVWGVVFLLVGVLGFVSNSIVGMNGFFHANAAHSIVHIVIGLVLLIASGTEAKARMWLKIVAVVYLLVALLGFFMTPAMGTSNVLGFIEVNSADNWLHVVLAVLLFLSGLSGGSKMGSGMGGSQQM